MIENMRKYTTLMVVVIVLLAAGLILTMNQSGGGRSMGSDFIHVSGVSLDRNDFAKEGKNSIAALRSTGSDMSGFVMTLTEAIPRDQADYFRILQGQYSTSEQLNFVTNRILLKQAAQELGIYASPEAAQEYISTSMFIGRDGTFDQKVYNNYISGLENIGLKESDFQNLVAEIIVFEKARDLIGGGLTPSNSETLSIDKLSNQQIGMEVISFQLEDFKKDLNPTEEEIKTFWETHKDKYKSERQLKITYALALLDDSDEPKRPTTAPDVDPAEATAQYLKAQEEWETNRKQVTKILRNTFSNFIDSIIPEDDEVKAVDFEVAAKKAQETAGDDFVLVQTDFFTADEAPEQIKNLMVKHAAPGTTVLNAILSKKFSTNEEFNIHFFGVGRDGDIAVRIDEEKLPATKSFEEAKELAKADLIEDLAATAMTKAAEDAKAKLTEATKTKSFSEAAQELSLTAKELKPFSAQTAPSDELNALSYYTIAQITEPKAIADEISNNGSSVAIIYVKSRTIEITGDEALRETQLVSQTANQMKYYAFNAWISGLKEAKSEEIQLPAVQ